MLLITVKLLKNIILKYSMKKVIIEKAKVSNFKEIFPLLKMLWPKKVLDYITLNDIFISNFKNKNKFFLIVKVKEEIVGFGTLHIRNNFIHNKIGIIDEIIISKNHRSKDLGRKLLNKLTEIAKKQNCKGVELVSGFSRIKSHKFYLKNKFKIAALYYFKKL